MTSRLHRGGRRFDPGRAHFMYIEKLIHACGRLEYLKRGNYSKEFADAIAFLKWNVKPTEIIAFSRVFMLAIFIATVLPLATFFKFSGFVFALFLSLTAGHLITEYPKQKTKIEKIAALNEIPNVIVNLVISLKQNSNLEEAVSFAGKYSDGPIAEDMKKIIWNHWSGKRAGISEQLDELAVKWGAWSPGFKHALYNIRASFSEKIESRRLRTLEKALEVVLDDIQLQNRKYAEEMRIPTMILFSFGTVLPLVAVSMLPILSFIGVSSASSLNITAILMGSLIAVYFYSNSIVARKPASYSQIKLPETKSYANEKIYAMALGILISFPGIIFLLGKETLLKGWGTLTIVGGIAVAIAIYNWMSSKENLKKRAELEDMENELNDVIYHLGSKTGENRSPEDAIRGVAQTMPENKLSAVLNQASELMRKRSFTMERAFFDNEHGVLRILYSSRIKSAFRIFVNSSKKSTKAVSEAMLSLSGQLSEIKKTNEYIQNSLTTSLSMMNMTAFLFGPIVCGLIVSMQGIMNKVLSRASINLEEFGYNLFLDNNSILSVDILQLMVGVYLIALSYLLIRFVSIIKSSNNDLSLKKDLTQLPIAFLVFVISIILSSGFL